VTVTSTITPTTTATISATASVTAAPNTVTVTSTISTTETVCPTPSLCGQKGLEYGVFNYASNVVNVKDSSCGGVNPPLTVYTTGVVNSIGGIFDSCSGPETVYGNPTSFPCQFFTVDHRGYFFAPEDGNYIFQFTGVDDYVYFWSGHTAYSGWTASNAQVALSSGQGSRSVTVSLVSGQYLPIRIMYGNAGSGGIFHYTIAFPNGDRTLIQANVDTPYVLQYSCDQIIAPPFVGDFGHEC
jgi:hypothetical protein